MNFAKPRQNLFEVSSDRILCIGPGIPLIGDESLKQTDGDGFGAGPLVFNASGKRRDVVKTCLFRQELSDLLIRIDPLPQIPEKLKIEFVLVEDRGIALFCLERLGIQRVVSLLIEQSSEHLPLVADQFTPSPSDPFSSRDRCEKGFAKLAIIGRIIEDSLVIVRHKGGQSPTHSWIMSCHLARF